MSERPLSILYVAYPLLTVSEASAGGAEQILFTLEREMARMGHRTMVAASGASQVAGHLLVTGEPVSALDRYEQREQAHAHKILEYLHDHSDEFDLIHDKSGSFFRHAAECLVPVLATLHLPRTFYRQEWFEVVAPNLFFNCVSQSQARSFADVDNMLGVAQNGIRLPELSPAINKEHSVLWLGRMCEEKAPHLAIEAAKLAGVPLTLAGSVYPFSYHRQYFEHKVRPHLRASGVNFIESPDPKTKARLLASASALLLTSTVEETSSLVAMEAMAMGTPVVAFRRGALPEIIVDGETGFLVESVEEMAGAIPRLKMIGTGKCQARVTQFFTAERMARDYERLYQTVLANGEAAGNRLKLAS